MPQIERQACFKSSAQIQLAISSSKAATAGLALAESCTAAAAACVFGLCVVILLCGCCPRWIDEPIGRVVCLPHHIHCAAVSIETVEALGTIGDLKLHSVGLMHVRHAFALAFVWTVRGFGLARSYDAGLTTGRVVRAADGVQLYRAAELGLQNGTYSS